MEAPPLYGLSECPVCLDSGAIICVRSRQSQELVFFCPLCGVAWHEPPLRNELNEILSLDDVAPSGITIPTSEEVEAAGYAHLERLPAEEWAFELEPLLQPVAAD